MNYPAAFDEVIAVGFVDEVAQRSEESVAGEVIATKIVYKRGTHVLK